MGKVQRRAQGERRNYAPQEIDVRCSTEKNLSRPESPLGEDQSPEEIGLTARTSPARETPTLPDPSRVLEDGRATR